MPLCDRAYFMVLYLYIGSNGMEAFLEKVTPVMCEHVVILCATTNGWRVGGSVQPFLGMWPSVCQSWVAIQMYSLESHGTENRGSFLQQFYTFLLDVDWLNTTPYRATARARETSTPQSHGCCCTSSFFVNILFCIYICTCPD